MMQRVQRMGVPWIISLWSLPERFYTDPNQKPFGTFARQIAPERWPEFLDLLGSYLQYLKAHYGAEPDLFSFNESDLGVNVGFTAETHRDEIKRIGAYLASLGLKTKMLLGDTANPRDSHKFVLAAAADPEAMRYVGAVSVHSWGSGTPAQYGAWGDVAEWLGLPLLVAEAGVDPGAYKNKMYDSYAYGLREARQFQDLLRYARPQALIYWQFTDDYGLVRVGAGGAIEPTGRFWLMKQFVNLSPSKSEVIASSSDQPDVAISAFAKGESVVVHVLNAGPDRESSISGLAHGSWRTVTTTESAGYQEAALTVGEGAGPQSLHLPARSLTTLVRE
jgi:O-glycosyl hydrolase